MFEESIDIERIQHRLDAIAEIGETDRGGVTCLAYSEEESEAVEYIIDELPSEYHVEIDQFGNIFATRNPDTDRTILLGSHLDSVYNGGRFDGKLGVVTGLEAIEALYDTEPDPDVPPTLAVFRGEESSRFNVGTIGSRCALGLLQPDQLNSVDRNGVSLAEGMRGVGAKPPEDPTEPTLDIERITGFLELHIEQGPILEGSNDEVGVVTDIRAQLRHRVTVYGQYDHSGATPMDLRQDALAGAAEMVTEIRRIGTEAAAEGDLVATVGDLTAFDAAINKVNGEVSFSIDVRSTDTAFRECIQGRIDDAILEIADKHGLRIEREFLDRKEPVTLTDELIETIDDATDHVGAQSRRLSSGGGHDAMNFAYVGIPTGMIFTPSTDGLSHHPDEHTDIDAIEEATKILAETLRKVTSHP